MTTTSTAKSTSVNTKYYIHAAISIAIMLFFRFIPPFDAMTELGMTISGIFVGALWGWINCGMIWTSILALVLLGLTDAFGGSASAAVTAAITNPTIQQLLWLLIIAALLTTTGISEQLTHRLVSSNWVKGRPWLLSMTIIMATFICAAFQCGYAATLICWEFVYTISGQVGYTKEDKWPRMMLTAITFANSVGVSSMPVAVGVIATFGYLTAASGNAFVFDPLQYMLFGLVFCVAIMFLYFLLARLLSRPDMTKLKTSTGIKVGEITPFTKHQKVALGLVVALIILIILPSLLPMGNPLKAFMNGIGNVPLILLMIGVAIFGKDKAGKPFFSFDELAGKGIMWNMMFMVAAATTIGIALSAPETGFTTMFTDIFTPMFDGRSPYFFTLAICIFTLILTNFVNNAVAGAIMIPVMFAFAPVVGANPLTVTAMVCVIANIGMILPCSCPAAAMLCSNEWMTQKAVWKYSYVTLIAVAIASAVFIPYANLIFS